MSKPRGTLKYTVGITLRRLASEVANSPGAGLPPSTWSVPPLRSTRLKLWLAPKVWLQGSQSRITSSRASLRNDQVWALACWLEVSMRWVLITAFGVPVEPEVNRNFAIVSGVTSAKARSTSGVSGVAAIERNEIASASPAWPLTMAAECRGWIADSAPANGLVAET